DDRAAARGPPRHGGREPRASRSIGLPGRPRHRQPPAHRLRRLGVRPDLQGHVVRLPGVLAPLCEIVSAVVVGLRDRDRAYRSCARARPRGRRDRRALLCARRRLRLQAQHLERRFPYPQDHHQALSRRAAAVAVHGHRPCPWHRFARLCRADLHHLFRNRPGAAAADRGAVDRTDAARLPVDRRRLDPRYGHARAARGEAVRLSFASRAGRRTPPGTAMKELVRTNDMVLVSAVGALLDGAKIPHMVLDQNMSVLEGSLGVLPRRILVAEDDLAAARRLLTDAGLGHELRPDAADQDALKTSEDAVLGGRLRLRQPLVGHRVGHDAILLAAATGGRAGEHAVDLGAGVGAAGLALAMRVPALKVTLVEIDAALSALAADNARTNSLADRVRAVTCNAEDVNALAAAGLAGACADRVLMNPPFQDAARHNVSPDALRRLAHAGGPGLLARWIAAAAFLLRTGGALTLIWRADE